MRFIAAVQYSGAWLFLCLLWMQSAASANILKPSVSVTLGPIPLRLSSGDYGGQSSLNPGLKLGATGWLGLGDGLKGFFRIAADVDRVIRNQPHFEQLKQQQGGCDGLIEDSEASGNQLKRVLELSKECEIACKKYIDLIYNTAAANIPLCANFIECGVQSSIGNCDKSPIVCAQLRQQKNNLQFITSSQCGNTHLAACMDCVAGKLESLAWKYKHFNSQNRTIMDTVLDFNNAGAAMQFVHGFLVSDYLDGIWADLDARMAVDFRNVWRQRGGSCSNLAGNYKEDTPSTNASRSFSLANVGHYIQRHTPSRNDFDTTMGLRLSVARWRTTFSPYYNIKSKTANLDISKYYSGGGSATLSIDSSYRIRAQWAEPSKSGGKWMIGANLNGGPNAYKTGNTPNVTVSREIDL